MRWSSTERTHETTPRSFFLRFKRQCIQIKCARERKRKPVCFLFSLCVCVAIEDLKVVVQDITLHVVMKGNIAILTKIARRMTCQPIIHSDIGRETCIAHLTSALRCPLLERLKRVAVTVEVVVLVTEEPIVP